MANRRWVCPNCGAGLHAPGKIRMDDVRRYCLDCSTHTGRLVKRTVPALDRKRETAKALRRDKLAAAKAAEKDLLVKRYQCGSIDVRTELKRLCRLPLAKARRKGLAVNGVDLSVSRSVAKGYSTGRAWWDWKRIHLSLTANASEAEAKMILVHELAHLVASRTTHHGEEWRRVYLALVKEAYGVDVTHLGSNGGRTYQLDKAVEAALAKEGEKVVRDQWTHATTDE